MSADKPSRGEVLSDDEVVKRAKKRFGTMKYGGLFSGQDVGHKNKTAADVEFCSYLATFTCDEQQIRRILSSSKRWTNELQSSPLVVLDVIRRALLRAAGKDEKTFPMQNATAFIADIPTDVRTGTQYAPMPPVPAAQAGERLPCATSQPDASQGQRRRMIRKASEIPEEQIRYFVDPWIPLGELSFIIGDPGTGKSSLLAHFCSFAKAALIFPGFEGSVARMLVPRLRAHGCNLDRVIIMEETGWTMPSSLKAVIAEVNDAGADLVIIDPIDSYMDDGVSENSAEGVRPALEAWQKVAEVTGAAVVAVRHPGKATNNPCPGSRAWRAVPRRILQLKPDTSTRPRNFIHVYKPGTGQPPPDTYYDLEFKVPGKPPVFKLAQSVPLAEAELARMVSDCDERRAIDVAIAYLKAALADGEQLTEELVRKGGSIGLTYKTLYRALLRLGGATRMEGTGPKLKHFWTLTPLLDKPKEAEPAKPADAG